MVFRDFQSFCRVFRGPLRDPLRGRLPSKRLSVLLPLIVLPLELSPKDVVEAEDRNNSTHEHPRLATLSSSRAPSQEQPEIPWRADQRSISFQKLPLGSIMVAGFWV